MRDFRKRVQKAEKQVRSRGGPSWLEMVQAQNRLSALVLKRLNAAIFGLPEPLPYDLEDRLIRRVEERVEAREGPWPDT